MRFNNKQKVIKPMNQNSTLKDNRIIRRNSPKPSTKSLDFLKMFARAYKVEKTLPPSMNEVYVN